MKPPTQHSCLQLHWFLGPLTNVALAMKLDPDFSSRLKSLFIMGGNIGNISINIYGSTLLTIVNLEKYLLKMPVI